jgi:hypothetical protein
MFGYQKFSKVEPGLYVGNIQAAQDLDLLKQEGITHIVAAAAHAQKFHPGHFEYLQFDIEDFPSA